MGMRIGNQNDGKWNGDEWKWESFYCYCLDRAEMEMTLIILTIWLMGSA